MTITYKAEIPVTSQMIADQIVTAIEGGSTYWCDGFFLKSFSLNGEAADLPTWTDRLEKPWYSDHRIYEGPFEIHVTEIDEDGHQVLTPQKIQAGLTWLSKHHPHRIAEIVNEEGDVETADVFLQACLFGEIVYG